MEQLEGGYIGIIRKNPYTEGESILRVRIGEGYVLSKRKNSNVVIDIESVWVCVADERSALLSGDGQVYVNGVDRKNSTRIFNNDIFTIETFSFQFVLTTTDFVPPKITHADLLLFDLKRCFPTEQWLDNVDLNNIASSLLACCKERPSSIKVAQHFLTNMFSVVDFTELQKCKDAIKPPSPVPQKQRSSSYEKTNSLSSASLSKTSKESNLKDAKKPTKHREKTEKKHHKKTVKSKGIVFKDIFVNQKLKKQKSLPEQFAQTLETLSKASPLIRTTKIPIIPKIPSKVDNNSIGEAKVDDIDISEILAEIKDL
ncbi:hypothetical protein EIN_408680 [Entamoeba invadens IP1]|uniref:FHA domain-containing protein n=1 Tax=Entamoeba invadens IP1 TaxID=370355 RepID=A0A0A1TWL4_ENTIV|nr:hypothetical protein EIN_408680 [Entamoeba invadens IP1]ELP85599.1 hypothetical protein EIN_408680 [Entamoeba invadens IP1]|eukprot:XP_004184945.1 hypothetical protein EIN_408680 [Entamoeba invadens IP1]